MLLNLWKAKFFGFWVSMNLLHLIQSEPSAKLKQLVRDSEACQKDSSCTSQQVHYSQEELRKRLTPQQFDVTQMRGTEKPFTGKFVHNHGDGVYTCSVCDQELFLSSTKYNSGSGWPSFHDVIHQGRVHLVKDSGHGMLRVEVRCSKCGAHLGHLFDDGPRHTSGLRYCMNSASLGFQKAKAAAAAADETVEELDVGQAKGHLKSTEL